MILATTGSGSTTGAGFGGQRTTGCIAYDPDGSLIGKLHLPEVTANFTFGGPQGNQIYACSTSSLFSLRVNFRVADYPS